MNKLRLIAMDVDGTLTDGKLYIGQDGEMMKAFCAKDGMGIAMLREYDVIPAIITGRKSNIVVERAKELAIKDCYQDIFDKPECLADLSRRYGVGLQEMAYIGDDLNDLSAIAAVKDGGGLTGCPADAAETVQDAVDYVCQKNGGDGAVREFAEWLLKETNA